MTIANTYIEQYAGPDASEVSERQDSFDLSVDFYEQQDEFQKSSDFTQYHIYPAQNPVSRQLGPTKNGDDFSDSVVSNPTMAHLKRYAFGRSQDGLSYYGSMKSDSGVFLRQLEFEFGYDVHCISTLTSMGGSANQKDFTYDSSVLETQDLVVSSDIDIEQFDFLLTALPVPFSVKNPVDSDVYIRLANHSVDPLDPTTVVLRLNGVVKSGVVYTPFYGGSGGFDITWANIEEFSYGSRVDVRWEIYDTASPANRLVIEYWFTTVADEIGPRISGRTPEDGTTEVAITSSVVFDLLDLETGVDISTLELYVNNRLVELTSDDLTIVEIVDGYRVQYITPIPFLYGDVIPVVVKVSDFSYPQNTSFFVWTFTTQGSLAPLLINMDPAPCDTNVTRIRNVSFEVVDAGHGLSGSSIVMGVDNKQIDTALLIPIIHRFD